MKKTTLDNGNTLYVFWRWGNWGWDTTWWEMESVSRTSNRKIFRRLWFGPLEIREVYK